jgi:hypothetical protein
LRSDNGNACFETLSDSSEKNSGECLQKALAIFFLELGNGIFLRRLIFTVVFTTTEIFFPNTSAIPL